MKMNQTILSSAVVAGLTLFAGSAMAQEEVAADAEPTAEEGTEGEETAQADEEMPAEESEEPAEEEPMAEDPAEEEPMLEASASAEAEAPAEEAAEEDGGTPGWFRIDHDNLGLQLWAGATHTVGPVGIATDGYIIPQTPDGTIFGEFDIGVEIPAGPLLFIPMVGIGVDWADADVETLIAPQLFTYGDFGPIYLEWWSQFFFGGVFSDADVAGAWYNRLFVTYAISDEVAIGPQAEMTLDLNGGGLVSLPVGATIALGYGENNTLQLFAGYETQDDSGNNALAGRITFVRTW
jgi:hypothetical protein